MKKWILTLIICLALGFTAIGKTKVTIWFAGTTEALMEAVDDHLVPAFEKANPDIELAVEYIPWGELSTKLTTAFAGGIGPDIFMHGQAAIAGVGEGGFGGVEISAIGGGECGAIVADVVGGQGLKPARLNGQGGHRQHEGRQNGQKASPKLQKQYALPHRRASLSRLVAERFSAGARVDQAVRSGSAGPATPSSSARASGAGRRDAASAWPEARSTDPRRPIQTSGLASRECLRRA